MRVDLSAEIAGIIINPAIMNGAGIFSQPDILKRISAYDIGAVVTKSTGFLPREGNMEPILASVGNKSYINAVGLSNPGYREMALELGEVYPLTKPLICSIFGESAEDLREVASGLENYCEAFELNFSCPNITQGEKCGITIGRDASLVKMYTKAVKDVVKKPVFVKLTPSVYDIAGIAVAAEEGGADAIVAINTVAPAMKIDIYTRRPVLTAGSGGLSGRCVKPIGIKAVYSIYEVVDIPIIGGGGIETAEDIVEYMEAGADAVFIGSSFIGMNTKQVGAKLEQLSFETGLILEKLCEKNIRDLKGVAHG